MKERPILFSAPMVRAILEGRKTQTRRICKPAMDAALTYVVPAYKSDDGEQRPAAVTPGWFGGEEGDVLFSCPYGHPGDRLWVKETHAPAADCWGAWQNRMQGSSIGPAPIVHYRADGGDPFIEKWRPSIFMPRWASRITLEIVSVRVERLQDCSYEDAIAEGMFNAAGAPPFPHNNRETVEEYARRSQYPQRAYARLWDDINGAGSWEANPWVWVVEFKRITG
jgi:hypothetical protein